MQCASGEHVTGYVEHRPGSVIFRAWRIVAGALARALLRYISPRPKQCCRKPAVITVC